MYQAGDWFVSIYDQLRALAKAHMAKLPPGHTLDPTALVHEAFVKMHKASGEHAQDQQAYFFAAASEAMRQILVDHVRRRTAQKRGGDATRLELDEADLALTLRAEPDRILAINDALDALESEDVGLAALVKMRFFVGMSMPEIAAVLNQPQRTLERRWRYASARLRASLGDAVDEAPAR
jgi:RNA polymerase sigma factor (TIGR02999 family)